jgi:hypothetical protein
MVAAKVVGTEQDTQRLLESRYDLGAVGDGEALTPKEGARAHALESAQELAESRERLRQAMLGLSREHTETDAAREALKRAIAEAADCYGYIRGQVSNRLLNLRAAERKRLGEDALESRARTFERVFGLNPSDITNQSPERQLTMLTQIADGIAQDPMLSEFQLHAELADLTAQATQTQDALSGERSEDKDASGALQAARVGFDRAHSAHTALIKSILIAQDRLAERGQFSKAYDPAYAARRSAQRPIAEEPEAAAVQAELPALPDPATP